MVEAGKFNNKAGSSSGNLSGEGGEEEEQEEKDSNRVMMESLLKEWSAGGAAATVEKEEGEEGEGGGEEGDAEVPDDDALNEMMSTHDSELLLYQQMDRERRQFQEKQWAEQQKYNGKSGGRGLPLPMPSRLMDQNERPAWIQASSWSHKHAQVGPVLVVVSAPCLLFFGSCLFFFDYPIPYYHTI